MRVVVTAVGSRGDVQPMLGLAQALERAGHEVVVGVPEDFEVLARASGLSFVPVCESLEAVLKRAGSKQWGPGRHGGDDGPAV